MLTFYRMLPDDVARAQFEQNVESLREAVQALLEHVGARLETLPHLWRACTVFRLALAEIGFDHDQLNSQAAVSPSTMIMEMNMRNCAPFRALTSNQLPCWRDALSCTSLQKILRVGNKPSLNCSAGWMKIVAFSIP